MIEIMGTIYLLSFCTSVSLILWHYSFVHRQTQSPKVQTLNANLEKVKLYWSQSEGNFAALTPNSIEADHKKAKKSVLYIGILAFGSLIGLILVTAVILSSRYLARPRREVRVFQSPLVSEVNLSTEQISLLVEELRTA